MPSILSGILYIIERHQNCDNLYISPNHVSLSYIWFRSVTIYLFIHLTLFIWLLLFLFFFIKETVWSRSIKDLFICIFWTSPKDRTILFNLARLIWN